MNKNFIIVCFLFATVSTHAADPSVEEKVKTIRAHYSEIEGSLKSCKQVKRDLPEESTEGGELTAYLKDSSVRKLSAKFFGEMAGLCRNIISGTTSSSSSSGLRRATRRFSRAW
jgi:hypothetical protein